MRWSWSLLSRTVQAAAMLLCICAAPSNQPAPSSRNAEDEPQTRAANHHETSQATEANSHPTVPIVQDKPKNHRDIGSDPKKESKWYTEPDWWVAGFTAGLFFATLGLWVFTALLWWLTRQAVAGSVEGTRLAVEANEISRRTSERELRAYISITDIRIDNLFPGTQPKFSCIVKNVGKTVAFDVEIKAAVFLKQGDDRIYFPQKFVHKSDMSPSSHRDIRYLWDQALQADNLGLLHEGYIALIYAGIIRYKDVYGKNHHTTFKYRTHFSYFDKDGGGPLIPMQRGNKMS